MFPVQWNSPKQLVKNWEYKITKIKKMNREKNLNYFMYIDEQK